MSLLVHFQTSSGPIVEPERAERHHDYVLREVDIWWLCSEPEPTPLLVELMGLSKTSSLVREEFILGDLLRSGHHITRRNTERSFREWLAGGLRVRRIFG
jgi:hypothetical protein